MPTLRRHERVPLLADVTIRPAGQPPVSFAARLYNVSAGGAAFFCEHYFAPGTLATLDVALPGPCEPCLPASARRFPPATAPLRARLHGKTSWVRVEPDGNRLGIQFIPEAGDYSLLLVYLSNRRRRLTAQPLAGRRGFTLMESAIVVVIVVILATLGMPMYRQATEQARVDVAGANLRVIWSAQRLYWLEYRTYATSLNDLLAMDLVNTTLARSASDPRAPFVYQVGACSTDGFSVSALRNGSTQWIGQLQINEQGELTGGIRGAGGAVLTPPAQ